MKGRIFLSAALLTIALGGRPLWAGAVLHEAKGANAAAIQSAVDSFRLALGSNNGIGGTFSTGRREINWDGVPDNLSAPNLLPANFFNSNSPRGVVFHTSGNGFQVSAKAGNPTSTPLNFVNLNAGYGSVFTPFSPERLFVPLGSPVMDVYFFVPGSNVPATTNGFGAVFSDVDTAGAATLEFFDTGNNLLGKYSVPALSGSKTLSFLGVVFTSGEKVMRVRITSGMAAVGIGDSPPNADMVVMDDFIYGEPQENRGRKALAQYLPQIADGQGYRTSVVISNPRLVFTSGKVDFVGSDGRAISLTIGGKSASSFDFALPPRAVLRLQTDGSSASVKTGYAAITADAELDAVALFQYFDSQNNLLTEAGVQKAAPLRKLQTFAAISANASTGIALVNPGSDGAVLVLRLLNSSGLLVAEQVASLGAGQHFARFLEEIFSHFAGVSSFEGTLVVVSSSPVAATAVRMQLKPSITLSALPVSAMDDEPGADKREFDIRPLTGTYRGTWTSLSTGTGGAARIDIAANQANRTATLTIDFDGNYLGLADPPAQTLTGTFDASGARVRGKSDVFGDYDVYIDASGLIVGIMKNLAGGQVPQMVYSGLISSQRLDADYLVRQADGKVAASILRMEKASPY